MLPLIPILYLAQLHKELVLDEKNELYAALEIPEYWIVDIRASRVMVFRLQNNGKYQHCDYSVVLDGSPISLLQKTLQQLF